MKQPQLNLCRLLLAYIRNGDFLHVGGEEAIDIALDHLTSLNNDWMTNKTPVRKVLDAGSGLGGTAWVVSEKLSCEVWGIDIDEAAVCYAQQHYPTAHFLRGDILEADNYFSRATFSLIYMFNVLYGISDKEKALHSLSHIATSDAYLFIFDYVSLTNTPLELVDFAGVEMVPIAKDALLEKWWLASGWILTKEVDLTDNYIEWYSRVLKKLEINRLLLIEKFSIAVYDRVHATFTRLLNKLQKKELGGYLLFAKKY